MPRNKYLINQHCRLGILLALSISKFATSSSALILNAEPCDFDKYTTGCYSQANFICDYYTSRCTCHPDVPILIDQRLCVKRLKHNEICQYNEQCDNSKGLYCTYSDYKKVPNNLLIESARLTGERLPRCRFEKKNCTLTLSSATHHAAAKRTQRCEISYFVCKLPRLIWIFLFICLVALTLLLMIIKTQYYSYNRSFGQQRGDRESINGNYEAPPSYEVAIRMKQ